MNTQLTIPKSLVSVEWLFKNRSASNLVILDATIPKVGQKESDLGQNDCIENALFFDVKNVFSDQEAPFPNTAVTPEVFEQEVRKLGINNDSAIIVYDRHGVYSSPRVWWLFKTMGHDNVAVLDGGLPIWQRENYPMDTFKRFHGELGNFKVKYRPNFMLGYQNVLEAIHNRQKTILDARSTDRFEGLIPEPREGLRSGHIPNSKNLPYRELIDGAKMISQKGLTHKFESLSDRNSELIFSCGSGITACILALGAEISGYKNLAVYDGSWTEWGSLHELPIEK